MNIKITQLVTKAKELGDLSQAYKVSKMWSGRNIDVSMEDIELAISISESSEIGDELYNNYKKVELHERLTKLNDYINDIWILNSNDDKLTERERETHLHTINNMLNHRALI